jgi:hypothetical protein
MNTYHSLSHLKENKNLKPGDVLVLFGELFAKGYATGLVEEAKARGMTVIYSTVGRREKDGSLRPLNAEEISQQPQPLINVPLEAGFDLEPDDNGRLFVDHLKDVKLTNWEEFKPPPGTLDQSRNRGRARFQKFVQTYLQQLKPHLPPKANVVFAHLMAGGVPRAKIVLPLMNRIVKGTGDRFLSSDHFIKSEIGKLTLECFSEVTAETFQTLLTESTEIRKNIEQQGGQVSYLAYGYHGTEVLMGNNYVWQTYSPYLQGWAKMRLENYSREAKQKGISTCVYNCPEILTNSSSIFVGVEVSLYPLLGALQKETSVSGKNAAAVKKCLSLFKPEVSLEQMMSYTHTFFTSELIRSHCVFEKWPQGNAKEQLEKMLEASDYLIGLHRDPKQLVSFELSEIVFSACGKLMLNDALKPEAAVSWINHQVIAKI